MKYGEVDLGQVEALLNKLGGMEVLRAILSDALNINVSVAKTGRMITVGLYKSANQARLALELMGCKIVEMADGLLDKINFAASIKEEPEFVMISAAEVGFIRQFTIAEILQYVQKIGLVKCLATDVPAIRLACLDQPSRKGWHIGTDPVIDDSGDFHMFWLWHDQEGPQIMSEYGGFDGQHSPGDVFIFRRRKQTA